MTAFRVEDLTDAALAELLVQGAAEVAARLDRARADRLEAARLRAAVFGGRVKPAQPHKTAG